MSGGKEIISGGNTGETEQPTVEELQAEIALLKERLIDTTQGLAENGRDSLNARLSALFQQILMAGAGQSFNPGKVRLVDDQKTITTFQLPTPMEEVLLEKNPDGILEVTVNPSRWFTLHAYNPFNHALVNINPRFSPFWDITPPTGLVTPVIEAGQAYWTEVRGDDHMRENIDTSKGLIAAVERIFYLNGKMQPMQPNSPVTIPERSYTQ